jgi:3-oxoacyl-[acyl-carrier protein] reductase
MALAEEGASIALLHHPADVMSQQATVVAAEIRTRGGAASTFGADLRDPEEINATFGRVQARLGDPLILINNAAVTHVTPWDEIAVELWDEVMAVNVRAAWLCARAAIPAMRRARSGRIVNLSSIEVRRAPGDSLAYVTSKAALIGLTRSLARATGRDGVCVNAVMPGAILTDMEIETFGRSEERDQVWIDRQCVPRRGTPSDLTGLITHLCSDASAFTTGQVFTVDGGATHG